MCELPISRYVNRGEPSLFLSLKKRSVISDPVSFFLLGLPAFKPGEKVEIDFGMDDI